jgi:putative redox protein
LSHFECFAAINFSVPHFESLKFSEDSYFLSTIFHVNLWINNKIIMINKIEVSWKGQMLFESIAPEGTVMIDAAEDAGGQGKGLRPKAMMLTSLAGCTAMDIASLLKKMRAEVEDFKIEVEGNLTDEHPKIYDKVKVTYRFYGKNFKKDKIEKAVNLSVESYCGVMHMFRQFAEVSIEIQYFEK